MVRRCIVAGCENMEGLHSFPAGPRWRRRWLRAVGLGEDRDLPHSARVCGLHFTPDSYSNFLEVKMGFSKKLVLKSEAVPTRALPGPPGPPSSHREGPALQAKVPRTREVGCQTDPPPDAAPGRTRLAVRDRASTSMEVTFSESPGASSAAPKRKRQEVREPGVHSPAAFRGLVPPHKQRKFIVHEEQLLALFRTCPACPGAGPGPCSAGPGPCSAGPGPCSAGPGPCSAGPGPCSVDAQTWGSLLRVTQRCARCGFSRVWNSQPSVRGVPAGDLQLCAAVLFTGSSFQNISKFLGAFNIQGVSEQTFLKHRAELLDAAVSRRWRLQQDVLIREAAEGGAATLGGDLRADSPGRSANCGSYAMMDLNRERVMDVQLLQSRDGGGRVGLEKEGLVRSLALLEGRGVKVQAVVTEAHTGLRRFVREQRQDIVLCSDLWNSRNGFGKETHDPGKKRGPRDGRLWRRRLGDHLHQSTASSGDHVQKVHGRRGRLQPRPEARQKLQPSPAAGEKLRDVLLTPRLRKDVKTSPLCHTSQTEAFRRLLDRFSPQTVAFSFKETLSRLQIAALHYNENASRAPAAEELSPVARDREPAVRAPKSSPTFNYIDDLMALLFESVAEDAQRSEPAAPPEAVTLKTSSTGF